MAYKSPLFSRLWTATLVILFCLLIERIVGQQRDLPLSLLDNDQNENQQSDNLSSVDSNILKESEYINPNERSIRSIIEEKEEDCNCSNSNQIKEFIAEQNKNLFSKFYPRNENEFDDENIEDLPSKSDSIGGLQEIPLSDILNRPNIKIYNNAPKNILYEGKSNSELYEIPFSALLKAQKTVPRKTEGNEGPLTDSNQGLHEIPFSALFNIQNKKNSDGKDGNGVPDDEQVKGHDRKPYDDSNQIYFKYNLDGEGSKHSDYENDKILSISNDELKYIPQLTIQDSQPMSDYSIPYDTSQSNAENDQLKEILLHNEEASPSVESSSTSLTQESNGEIPVIYKPLDEKHYENFPLRKISVATFGQNSSYMPSILEAILESKRQRQLGIDKNILVHRLSSIFLAKKLEYSELTHDEVFTQLLLETFLATLKIIKYSESSCINHALEFAGHESYVEGLREILYLKRLFLQPHEDIGKLLKVNPLY